MFLAKRHLSRRIVLKGADVSIALPLLDAVIPAGTAWAKSAAAVKPRLGFVYFPHGAVQKYRMPVKKIGDRQGVSTGVLSEV
ncbi:MAG: hypothetical protein ACREUT_12125 [Steroidobacteraceae bacterium]